MSDINNKLHVDLELRIDGQTAGYMEKTFIVPCWITSGMQLTFSGFSSSSLSVTLHPEIDLDNVSQNVFVHWNCDDVQHMEEIKQVLTEEGWRDAG